MRKKKQTEWKREKVFFGETGPEKRRKETETTMIISKKKRNENKDPKKN